MSCNKLAALNANLTLSDLIFKEIRDYQRRLQAELRKRRDSVSQKIWEICGGMIGEELAVAESTPEKQEEETVIGGNHTNLSAPLF